MVYFISVCAQATLIDLVGRLTEIVRSHVNHCESVKQQVQGHLKMISKRMQRKIHSLFHYSFRETFVETIAVLYLLTQHPRTVIGYTERHPEKSNYSKIVKAVDLIIRLRPNERYEIVR